MRTRKPQRSVLETLEPRSLLAISSPTIALASLPSAEHGLWVRFQNNHANSPQSSDFDSAVKTLKGQAGPQLLGGLRFVEFPNSVALDHAQRLFSRNPQIAEISQTTATNFLLTSDPNDPFYAQQPGLSNANDYDINAPEAWNVTQGSSSTLAAVTDTGVNYTHSDLYLKVAINQGEIPASKAGAVDVNLNGFLDFQDLNSPTNTSFVTDSNSNGRIDAGDLLANGSGWEDGSDNDNNGYADDLVGWDFANADNDPYDDHGHGTHVTGTVAASTNNGLGVAGVDWNARIVPVKIFLANGTTTESKVVSGVSYAAARGAKAINASWGGTSSSAALKQVLDTMASANQTIFIAAAGNNGTNSDTLPFYPAAYRISNLVSVAAVDPTNGSLASYSNYGANTIDLAAPGSNILSTTLDGSYGYSSGTSMAAPHVTGLASLLYGHKPGTTASQAVNALKSNVRLMGSLQGKTVTGGMINAYRTLQDVVTSPTASIDEPSSLPPSSFTIRFSKPVTGVTANDFRLTRNGGSNLLTGLETVGASADSMVYTLQGTSSLATQAGNYTLTLVAANSGILDRVGNALTADAQRSFTINAPSTQAPTLVDLRVGWGSRTASLFDSNVTNRILPWIGISKVEAQFDSSVDVDMNDLKLQGQSFTYGMTTFAYNAATKTASWTLATPIGSSSWDALRPLGGDTLRFSIDGDDAVSDDNAGVSGSGGYLQQGDRVVNSIRVLPGDFDNNGVVTMRDLVMIRNLLATNNVYADLDGDNSVTNEDLLTIRFRLGKRL